MWKRIIKAWRVLMGTPTYNDDEHFMATKREMEALLKDLMGSMESVREFIPVMHTHQEFIKLNTQIKRLILFVRNNYVEEIGTGQHSRFLTIIDVALFYMSLEMDRRGKEVVPAPTEREVLALENSLGTGSVEPGSQTFGPGHLRQGGPRGQ